MNDLIVGLGAAMAALFSLFMAFRQFNAKKRISACLWLLGGCFWALVALFFLSFQIRLM